MRVCTVEVFMGLTLLKYFTNPLVILEPKALEINWLLMGNVQPIRLQRT